MTRATSHRQWVFLLAALLVGCGSGPLGNGEDFTSPGGVWVYLNGQADTGLDARTTGELEAQLTDGLVANGWPRAKMSMWLKHALVEVKTSAFPCSGDRSAGQECDGQQWANVLLVANTRCAWSSSYRHELAHFFQFMAGRPTDFEHTDPTVWPVVNSQPPGTCR